MEKTDSTPPVLPQDLLILFCTSDSICHITALFVCLNKTPNLKLGIPDPSISSLRLHKNESTKEEEIWSHPSLHCGAVAMKNNYKEDGWRREERKVESVKDGDRASSKKVRR